MRASQTASPSRKVRIALFLRQAGNEYQDLIRQDVRTSALRHGFVLGESDAQNKADLQLNQIQQALGLPQGVRPKAILVAPVEDAPLRRAAREAAQQGIAWVSLNRASDYLAEVRREVPRVAVFSVQPDQDRIGRIQAEQARILLAGAGEVAYIRGPALTASADERAAAFRAGLSRVGVRVTPLLGDWSVESGREAIKQWLGLAGRCKPDQCAVVAQNDSMAYGAWLALREAARRPLEAKIPIVGCNGTPEFGHRLVVEGTLAATVVLPSPGRSAVDTLAAVFGGAPRPLSDITIAPASFPEPPVLAAAWRKRE